MALELCYLECPCCGEDGAVSDKDMMFQDGQNLICACDGFVVTDDEDDEPHIFIDNCQIEHD